MQNLTMKGLAALAFVAALTAVPAHVTAQDPVTETEACTAQVNPAQVAPGEKAQQITVAFPQQVGAITGVEAAEGSGITLSAAADLPRTELAAGEPAPSPIEMGEGPNTWNVYLDLSQANAGTHELTFRSSEGDCTAEITVGADR
jgi:hypothetical protein